MPSLNLIKNFTSLVRNFSLLLPFDLSGGLISNLNFFPQVDRLVFMAETDQGFRGQFIYGLGSS